MSILASVAAYDLPNGLQLSCNTAYVLPNGLELSCMIFTGMPLQWIACLEAQEHEIKPGNVTD